MHIIECVKSLNLDISTALTSCTSLKAYWYITGLSFILLEPAATANLDLWLQCWFLPPGVRSGTQHSVLVTKAKGQYWLKIPVKSAFRNGN